MRYTIFICSGTMAIDARVSGSSSSAPLPPASGGPDGRRSGPV
jgi:hypothetical protein